MTRSKSAKGTRAISPAIYRPQNESVNHHSAAGLQFCVQKHNASSLHYDLRLELGGVLKSWAIPKGPSLDPKVHRLAVHAEDHSLDYATFEGHIPKGNYGAGEVIVWDLGIWFPEGDPYQAYAKGKLRFRLQGRKLGGDWSLFRTRLGGKSEQWLLVKLKDAYSRGHVDYDVLQEQPLSIISGKSLLISKGTKQSSGTA